MKKAIAQYTPMWEALCPYCGDLVQLRGNKPPPGTTTGCYGCGETFAVITQKRK